MKDYYTIEFPIGDWSDDGHGDCQWFKVASTLPVEELRELHFKAEEEGYEISKFCSHDYILTESDLDFLKSIKMPIDSDYWVRGEDYGYCHGDYTPYHIMILRVWLATLYKVSEGKFGFSIMKEERFPKITFYGYDEKKRHLNNPGYGIGIL